MFSYLQGDSLEKSCENSNQSCISSLESLLDELNMKTGKSNKNLNSSVFELKRLARILKQSNKSNAFFSKRENVKKILNTASNLLDPANVQSWLELQVHIVQMCFWILQWPFSQKKNNLSVKLLYLMWIQKNSDDFCLKSVVLVSFAYQTICPSRRFVRLNDLFVPTIRPSRRFVRPDDLTVPTIWPFWRFVRPDDLSVPTIWPSRRFDCLLI